MPASRHPGEMPAELPAAVEAAAEALVLLWTRAQEGATSISPSQLRALVVVEQHDGINLGGLADRIGALPSAASRLCDRLQAAGLLTRQTSPVDRREIVLALTRDGSDLLAMLRHDRRTDLGEVLERMSELGRTALLRGLEELRAAMARGVPSGP